MHYDVEILSTKYYIKIKEVKKMSNKRVVLLFSCILTFIVLIALPLLAIAEEKGIIESVDWTQLVVSAIFVLASIISAVLGRVWMNYVKPWLEQRGLVDACKIVVDAVEALIGRYAGEDKWELALEKLKDRGFNIDSDIVLDALRAAWKQLDLEQISSGEKKLTAEAKKKDAEEREKYKARKMLTSDHPPDNSLGC